jgi:hypothetical protein
MYMTIECAAECGESRDFEVCREELHLAIERYFAECVECCAPVCHNCAVWIDGHPFCPEHAAQEQAPLAKAS